MEKRKYRKGFYFSISKNTNAQTPNKNVRTSENPVTEAIPTIIILNEKHLQITSLQTFNFNPKPSVEIKIEKKSLEAHVELCAERYSNLETKLNNLDGRMAKLESHIVDIKDSLGKVGSEGNKTLITIGTAVFVAFLTAVLGLIVHLATK